VNARLRVLALSLPLLILSGCEWFTDFKRQPSLWTWEPVKDSLTPSRGNPQFSVPTNGTYMAGFQVSYTALPDSLAAIANPTPIGDASLENGRKYFQINCSVCHGVAGQGNGPAMQFGMPGINLTTDVTKGRTDGYIYGMIRNGRGLMPPYNRIEERDRWDVVNYLRGLQGMVGRTVETGPLAPPGVTGKMVPGFTEMGPTRPAPFFNRWKTRTAEPVAASSTPVVIDGHAVPPVTDSVRRSDATGRAVARRMRDTTQRDSARKTDSAGRVIR